MMIMINDDDDDYIIVVFLKIKQKIFATFLNYLLFIACFAVVGVDSDALRSTTRRIVTTRTFYNIKI